jgi:toxin ParE1/3/4
VKPVFWHPLARQDVALAAAWYAGQGGLPLELAFTAALEDALRHLMRHPGMGSERCAEALAIPGLRQWPIRKFPHSVFYLERPGQLDIWRVLHGRTDIPAWLGDPDNDPTDPPQ